MAIFQKSVIKKHLRGLNTVWLDTAYDKFNEIFTPKKIDTIIKLKEEEYQDGFLRDLFVGVLGYTLKPDKDFNLVREFKNQTDGKKADGAIIKDEKAVAVIELKSTKTKDLTSITQQAFNYKNNQPGCKYVITSNFQKLRFYVDYSNEYEEFDLFNLQKTDFELLYLILRKNAIFNDLPQKLKDETRFHEKNISEQLYKDYSNFKNKIFENIVKRNSEIDKLTLFKKSQKLLDRLLFIFFAEDCGLLPANSISRIIDRYDQLKKLDAYKPLYEIYLQYFGYMNIGRKGQIPADDIPAYNGGLFAPDELLDNLKIDDKVLKADSLKLSAYDFNTDVDVNILGHIFEHSLNEIEEMEQNLSENDSVSETKTSKRKKDGVFYTPKYITQYIVENTIGTLCTEKRKEMNIYEIEFDTTYKTKKGLSKKGKELFNILNEYKEWLKSLKILDPACGSGAFLNQTLQFLITEHKLIDDLIADLTGDAIGLFDTDKSILENNLYGVDINDESVEIAKLSLWLRTAQKGRKLSNLNNNIKCGNSLIDNPEVAGDKAFDWNIEFKEIMDKGGFDVVIGNPPYVKVQNLKYEEIDWLKNNKITAFKRIDISTIFFEITKTILKRKGIICFITSNQFQTTEYGQKTRKFIAENFQINKIIDFGDLPIFKGALTYVSIYNFRNDMPTNFKYKKVSCLEDAISGNYTNFINIDISGISEKNWTLVSKTEKKLLKKLEKLKCLEEFGNAWAGLFTGLDKVLMFSSTEMIKSKIEKELFLPIIRASDPVRNGFAEPSKYVIYPYVEKEGKTVVLKEDELKEKYPIAYKYLLSHKEELQKRKDSRKTFKERADWYGLTRFGRKEIFKKEKIVSPGEVKNHKFSLDKTHSGFSCARVFAITLSSNFPINGLLAILNSSLASFFLQRNASVKAGGYFSYSSNVLNSMPIVENIPNNLVIIENKLLLLNKELQTEKNNFLNTLQEEKSIEKLSTKLQNFQNLEYEEFKKELRKKKVKINLGAENNEWREYFNTSKQKINELQTQINQTDKKIDKMVYELYELTDEEVEVVENSVK